MILKCNCSSHKGNTAAADYQDARYGEGMRVHTPGRGIAGTVVPKCAVCGGKKEPRKETDT